MHRSKVGVITKSIMQIFLNQSNGKRSQGDKETQFLLPRDELSSKFHRRNSKLLLPKAKETIQIVYIT